jgi:hypothetical protein
VFKWDNIITEIFGEIDDFCKILDKKLRYYLLEDKTKQRRKRVKRLSKSEIMIILIANQICNNNSNIVIPH